LFCPFSSTLTPIFRPPSYLPNLLPHYPSFLHTHEKTQKQIKNSKKDFKKHQSETKDTIKREMQELKRITQIIKEELNKDMENLRKRTKQISWK
jgi:hypothetical protein